MKIPIKVITGLRHCRSNLKPTDIDWQAADNKAISGWIDKDMPSRKLRQILSQKLE